MTTRIQKLKAVVSIRNLVIGIDTEWKELRSLAQDIDSLLEQASELFLNNAAQEQHESWLVEQGKISKEKVSFKEIMNESIKRINKRNSTNLAAFWSSYEPHSNALIESLHNQSERGKVFLKASPIFPKWESLWDEIFSKMIALQEIAKGSVLQLAMMEEFAPKEMDELTDTILKHMPRNYSMEEALQYEKEYMEAYDQLKIQASQKKNLWDRFLDVLAGGQQQSPAEMLMMQRWVNGEKGDL